MNDADVPTITVFDVSSGKLKAQESFGKKGIIYLPSVKAGLVVTASDDTPKLWNCQLSMCIRGWSSLDKIAEILTSSDEHVACVRKAVSDEHVACVRKTVSDEHVACVLKHRIR